MECAGSLTVPVPMQIQDCDIEDEEDVVLGLAEEERMSDDEEITNDPSNSDISNVHSVSAGPNVVTSDMDTEVSDDFIQTFLQAKKFSNFLVKNFFEIVKGDVWDKFATAKRNRNKLPYQITLEDRRSMRLA